MAEWRSTVENVKMERNFYSNKKVLVTGHTGFKGAWLCEILRILGADVIGYSDMVKLPSLYHMIRLDESVRSYIGDIRDFDRLRRVFHDEKPEIVFHFAAQPIVRESYQNPIGTYETNVMGTVNICECIRTSTCVRSFLNVTTDKVYLNREWSWGYREDEMLDGFDPYSNSKSCSELVTHSYINSFFCSQEVAASTARAGNVIGGGDFSEDRIIPDCIRSAFNNEKICVRNPNSIRPYQHVLEPLLAYLLIAEKQYEDRKYAGYYNVGPSDEGCITTGELVDLFCNHWSGGIAWEHKSKGGPHEANFLKLDCSKIKHVLGWKPKWNIDKAVEKTVEMAKQYMIHEAYYRCMQEQILDYLES